MLILPPPNHSACGGSHFSTVSHVLNQFNSSSASRAQKASGSAAASARRRSSSAIDLMCARSENDAGGGKIRCSRRIDSMFVVTLDMRACVPYFIATKKHKKHKYVILISRNHFVHFVLFRGMTLYVGTSGYSYKEWKGRFYPETIAPKDMLSYYASHLHAVELNNTFYRMPQPSMIESWKAQVPENFRFSVKAPQSITHFRRLNNASAQTQLMLKTIAPLEERLGAVIFRLPENM